MTFKEELERILEALTFEMAKWNYGAVSAEAKGERYKASQAITELVIELIGDDEVHKATDLGIGKLPQPIAADIITRNQLRAELKRKVTEENE